MLNNLKPKKSEEQLKSSRFHRRLILFSQRPADVSVSQNHTLKVRITELEAEIARLRSTVKFLTDMYLEND